MKISSILIVVILIGITAYASDDEFMPTADNNFERGYYVPVDLYDCFKELDKGLSAYAKNTIKNTENEFMSGYHFGLGMWIRNNWIRGSRSNSRLSTYFNGLGIFHPDDMSGIILRSYWKYLNGKPIELETQVEWYKKFWQTRVEPPEFICPTTNEKVILGGALSGNIFDNDFTFIQWGTCKGSKEIWVYEYNKGWYKPGDEIIKRIRE